MYWLYYDVRAYYKFVYDSNQKEGRYDHERLYYVGSGV